MTAGRTLPYFTGDWFERTFPTPKGPVGLLAQVEINGKTLWLKDIAVYATASREALSGLEREVLAARTQIMHEARSMGFDKLRLSYQRHQNSTSRNPGKEFDITIDLTK